MHITIFPEPKGDVFEFLLMSKQQSKPKDSSITVMNDKRKQPISHLGSCYHQMFEIFAWKTTEIINRL